MERSSYKVTRKLIAVIVILALALTPMAALAETGPPEDGVLEAGGVIEEVVPPACGHEECDALEECGQTPVPPECGHEDCAGLAKCAQPAPDETPACGCEAQCAEGEADAACGVCAADPSLCAGKAETNETPAAAGAGKTDGPGDGIDQIAADGETAGEGLPVRALQTSGDINYTVYGYVPAANNARYNVVVAISTADGSAFDPDLSRHLLRDTGGSELFPGSLQGGDTLIFKIPSDFSAGIHVFQGTAQGGSLRGVQGTVAVTTPADAFAFSNISVRKHPADPTDNRFLIDFTLTNAGAGDLSGASDVPLSIRFGAPGETDPTNLVEIVPAAGVDLSRLTPGGSVSFTDIEVTAPAAGAGFDPASPIAQMQLSAQYGDFICTGANDDLVALPCHGGAAGAYLASLTGHAQADTALLGQIGDHLAGMAQPQGVCPSPFPVPACYPEYYVGGAYLDGIAFAGENLSTLFAPIPNISVLSLSGTGADLTTLPTFSNLTNLYINDNGYASLPGNLASKTPGLLVLEAERNAITDAGPIAALSNLTHAYLAQNNIAGLAPFAGHQSLILLDVSDNTAFQTLAPLSGLPDLRHFFANSCALSMCDLPAGTLSQLAGLELDGNLIVDFSFIEKLTPGRIGYASAIRQARATSPTFQGTTLRVENLFTAPAGYNADLTISDGGYQGSIVWDNAKGGHIYTYALAYDATTPGEGPGNISGIRFGGRISVTPTQLAPDPDPSGGNAKATTVGASPKTGDGANTGLYIALCMAAGAAITGVAAYRRRRRSAP